MQAIWRDIRFTLRAWRRRPALTALSLALLALGIGATASIFSVVHGVLLRSLPYSEPDRIARVWASGAEGDRKASLRVIELEAFEDHANSVEWVGGQDRTLTNGGTSGALDPELLTYPGHRSA